MVIYTVCLGMTFAVEAEGKEEALEKLDHGIAGQKRGAWEFDMYDVSKVDVRDGIIIIE